MDPEGAAVKILTDRDLQTFKFMANGAGSYRQAAVTGAAGLVVRTYPNRTSLTFFYRANVPTGAVKANGRPAYQTKYILIGDYFRRPPRPAGHVTLEEARQEAARLRSEQRKGTLAQLQPKIMTVAELAETWMRESVGGRLAPSTERTYRSLLQKIIRHLGRLDATTLQRETVRTMRDEIAAATTSQADKAVSCLATIYSFALSEGLLPGLNHNPAAGFRTLHKPKSTANVFLETDDHILVFWHGVRLHAGRAEMIAIHLIGLLTGLRRSEITNAAISEIRVVEGHGPVWQIPADRMLKTKQVHVVPLAPRLEALINECIDRFGRKGQIFAPARADSASRNIHPHSASHAAKRLRDRVPELPDGFRFHGLRHTVVSGMSRLGIDREVRHMATAHQLAGASTQDRHYNHWSYMPERRQAFERWEAEIERIVGHEAFWLPLSNHGARKREMPELAQATP